MTRAPAQIVSTRATWQRSTGAVLSRLDRAGVTHEKHDEQHILVAGEFVLNPQTQYWRNADQSRQGYTLATLIAAAKKEDAPGFTVKVPVRLSNDQHHKLRLHAESIGTRVSTFLRESALDKLELATLVRVATETANTSSGEEQ